MMAMMKMTNGRVAMKWMERVLLEEGCGSLMVSTVGRREFEPTVGRRD